MLPDEMKESWIIELQKERILELEKELEATKDKLLKARKAYWRAFQRSLDRAKLLRKIRFMIGEHEKE